MRPGQEPEGTVPAPASAKGELETILDGTFLELTRIESGLSITDRVKVRKISIQKMDVLGKAWGKMQQEVCCYIDRPLDYVESLTEESFIAAMSEGRRLNFPSFAIWFKWQSETAQALGNSDLMQKAMSLAVVEAVKGIDSRPSPKS
jgi:hypothetical protein